MKFTELEPQFVRYGVRREMITHLRPGIDPLRGNWTDADWITEEGDCVYYEKVDTIEEAQGVDFLCPKCFVANGGPVGTHSVICWSRSKGVPDDAKPGPGRWRLVGTSFEDLSLMEEPGQSRSVLLTGSGCGWHGFITNGDVTDA